MQCPRCNTDNPEQAKFCNECGGKLEIVCPQCGTSNSPGSKFCNECGRDLRKTKKVLPIDYSEPHSYTPKHLADKILLNRTAVEGERKLVTILFADLANSTEMFESLDPEQVHEIMDGCFRILMDEIHRYEGTINQFTGDGVMALFGAPIAHEDHAQRACYASLAIQESLRPYAGWLKREYGLDFTMRIGLNSGSVVVGAIGDDLRMDYTAQGDTANLAARMESSAEPGRVLASEHTYKLAGGFFDFEPVDEIQVKGKPEPVKTFLLMKPSEIATRIEASAAKGLTRFVGRKRELETLKDAFDKTRSGEGQVVGVVGEAGVGKSRLMLEFRNSLPKSEYIYLEGRCLHYGSSMPYLPILDAFRSYLGIKEGETESVIRQKMIERIVGSDENLKRCLPPIQELFSIKVDDEEFTNLEPKQKREKTFEAIRDILIRGSQTRTIVMAIEDLHWIDKTTEEFLDYMIGWLPGSRILLILLYRPEYTHQWGSKSYYSKVGVGQLSSNTSAELVQAILEGGAVVPELRELILSRAAGNPLFMEELTHSLLENGSIGRAGDRYVFTRTVTDIQVPDSIQGIIAARMDRLEENLKRIMQVASVIGKEFAFRVLQAIAEMKEDLKSNLLNLQGLEFIYEKSLFPELAYVFKHALTQEVAYNSLLLKRRKQIHERIALAIEDLYPERLEEFYEMLAFHFSRSENAAKACHYLKLAGDKAVRGFAMWEAYRLLKKAIDTARNLPETLDNRSRLLEMFRLLAYPLRLLGFPQGSLELLQEGESLARDLEERSAWAYLHSAIGLYYCVAGSDPVKGREYIEGAISEVELTEGAEIIVPTMTDLIASYMIEGRYMRVCELTPKVIDLLEKSHTEAEHFGTTILPYSYLHSYFGMSLGSVGNFDEGERKLQKGLSFARDLDNLHSLAMTEMCYGIFHYFKGDGPNQVKHYRASLEYMEKGQFLIFQGLVRGWLGIAYEMMELPEEALRHLDEGLRIHTESGLPFFLGSLYTGLSKTHLVLGNLQKARVHAEQGIGQCQKNNEKFHEAESRIALGRAVGASGPEHFEEAQDQMLNGIRILEELYIRSREAVGYLYLGELQATVGRKDEALENVKKAESRFREMGMDYWLGKAQVALAGL